MDIDTLHADLRKRLDILGFNHPLPLGAIGIVSAILSDLIKTSEKLKSSKQQIEQLMQEKVAWELGVEPYKCDNSRLLSEVNNLHLELVKQRDKFVLANTELKCRVRNLQTDKKQLDERCLLAEAKIRELVHSADSKSRKNGVNMQRKPFVSTVRAGYYQPPKCCDAQAQDSKCHCPCNQPRKTDVLHEIERLQAETKNQEEVIDAYKKQGHEAWTMLEEDLQSLEVFERRVLRTLFGGLRENNVWSKRMNHELAQLYDKPIIRLA